MSKRNEQGAVSIFVVIFTALLISIITVGFIRIMLRDQQQATALDLSQSAYDSALVGVEDAKRALSKYINSSGTARTTMQSTLNSGECGSVANILYGTSVATFQEQRVSTNEGGNDELLDQAYTCTTISLRTDDYVREARADSVEVVPLQGVSTFNRIRVQWYSQEDLSGSATLFNVPLQPTNPLPAQSAWGVDRPPLLEVQLMQHGGTFTLNSFDSSSVASSNSNTLSLYPQGLSTTPTLSFSSNQRRSAAANGLEQVRCLQNVSDIADWGEYSCRADIQLPNPIGGGARTAFLRITPRYGSAHYKVSLYNATSLVQFDGTQPLVDSTGRANDLFRRVQVRVEPGSSAVYPEGAVDVSGNFCKSFTVSLDTADYSNSCTP